MNELQDFNMNEIICNFAQENKSKKSLMIPEIHIEDFNYSLPDERIAKYPLSERDASKLLHYRNSTPVEAKFADIAEFLPSGSMMVFNDTKVVPARLHFQRETGAHIEIFCLEPVLPQEYVTMFEVTDRCRWKCIVGNVKRWKSDILHLYNPDDDFVVSDMNLRAELIERSGETSVIEFTWTNGAPFSKVLEICGSVPIPPYLNRDTEDVDLERYQTLYAKYRGSVAAPTAGLHFTEKVLKAIKAKDIDIDNVCLHVGAGTFLPVKSSLVSEHTMHREPFVVTRTFLEKLLARKGKLIAVGTTSVRTLESLYYVGVKCHENGVPEDVCQWDPYIRDYSLSFEDSISSIIGYMQRNSMENIQLGTSIIIVPGYEFKVVDILVTNFHQPQSTLLLLISAFVGGDWKNIYDFALGNGFRFLSYGDSSLLFRN